MKNYQITLLLVLSLWMSQGFCADDPTRPESIIDVQGENPWALTVILVSKERRVAVMQDKFVSVGSKIDGAEVIAIEPGYVLLKSPEGILKVFLFTNEIKQPNVTVQK